jgi:hypothetical protein
VLEDLVDAYLTFETKVEYCRGEGPKLKHNGFASPPFIGMGRYTGTFRQPIA